MKRYVNIYSNAGKLEAGRTLFKSYSDAVLNINSSLDYVATTKIKISRCSIVMASINHKLTLLHRIYQKPILSHTTSEPQPKNKDSAWYRRMVISGDRIYEIHDPITPEVKLYPVEKSEL